MIIIYDSKRGVYNFTLTPPPPPESPESLSLESLSLWGLRLESFSQACLMGGGESENTPLWYTPENLVCKYPPPVFFNFRIEDT